MNYVTWNDLIQCGIFLTGYTAILITIFYKRK